MKNLDIIMYTTGCPKCAVLEKKLLAKGLEFRKVTDVDEMQKMGIDAVPVLVVNKTIPNEDTPYTNKYNFSEAVKWINSL